MITFAVLLLSQTQFQASHYVAVNVRRLDAGVATVARDRRLELAAEIQANWVSYASRRKLPWTDHVTDTAWAKKTYPGLRWDLLRFEGDTLDPRERAILAGYPIVTENQIVVGEANENGYLGGKTSGANVASAYASNKFHYANMVRVDWEHVGCSSRLYPLSGGNHAAYTVFAYTTTD